MSKHRLSHHGLRAALLALAVALAGCSGEEEASLPTETIAPAPLRLTLEAEGQVRAVQATPLTVPGQQWSQRQLVWMKADGSPVVAGELVARFAAPQGRLELDKALLDLQRNELARVAKEGELDAKQGRVDVDLSQVGIQLAIAQRYADADLDMFSRHEILDAIQDEQFLGARQDMLQWSRGQGQARGAAELAVLDSQRATFDLNAQTRQQDLEALELRAPNAGVLVLATDWSGEKPKLGATMWAGREFAQLPDPAQLEVEVFLPQLEAQGIAAGVEVELYPIGRPEQVVTSALSWVASAPAVRGRGNPVRYLAMRAPLPQDAAQRHGWTPGQAFRARLHLRRSEEGLSVPNVAIVSDSGRSQVMVRNAGGWEARTLTLGVRGPGRSEVLDGLAPGDEVLLTPAALPRSEA